MTDPAGGPSGSESRCPWCSSVVASDAATCPSCGAVLREPANEEPSIPGVTSIDPSIPTSRAIARPNRLVRLIAGDLDPLPPDQVPRSSAAIAPDTAAVLAGAGQAAVAPPSEAVRREMARLELEAIRAELEAQAAEVPAMEVPAAEVPAAEVPTEGDAPA